MDRRTELYIRDIMVMIIQPRFPFPFYVHHIMAYQSSVSWTTTSNLVPWWRIFVSNYLDKHKYSKLTYRCAPKIVLDSCLAAQLHQARSLYWASLPFQLISKQSSILQQERKKFDPYDHRQTTISSWKDKACSFSLQNSVWGGEAHPNPHSEYTNWQSAIC